MKVKITMPCSITVVVEARSLQEARRRARVMEGTEFELAWAPMWSILSGPPRGTVSCGKIESDGIEEVKG